MMALGDGGPLIRRRMRVQPTMPGQMQPPIVAEVMQIRPVPMPQPPQFGGGFTGGLADSLRRMMVMGNQPPQTVGVDPFGWLSRLFGGGAASTAVPAQPPVYGGLY